MLLGHDRLVQFYSQFVEADDLCFDIGASLGNCTAALRALYAKVVCVEPQPRIVQMLHHRFGNDPFVRIVPKGLAARQGCLPMFISEHDHTVSTFAEKWKTGRFKDYTKWNITQNTPVTTLDALIQEYGIPKFCKIDTEGFEYEVLRGLSTPIPVLSFEFTEEFLDDARHCANHIATINNKVEFNFSLATSLEWGLPEWVETETLFDSLHSHIGGLAWGDIYARSFKETDNAN